MFNDDAISTNNEKMAVVAASTTYAMDRNKKSRLD